MSPRRCWGILSIYLSRYKQNDPNSNVHRHDAVSCNGHQMALCRCFPSSRGRGRRRKRVLAVLRFRPAASFLPLTAISRLRSIRPDSQRHAASLEDPGEPRSSRPAGTRRGPAGQHLLQARKGKDRRCCKSAGILNHVSLEAKLRAQCRPWL